ncbi:MAG: ATP-dependent helicase HrpB [Desertimonas sp.]
MSDTTRPPLPDLPILEIVPALRAALTAGTRAVVSAPPGAGKSTVIPLALLGETWLGADLRIVMLEPRRLATRATARRMADLTHTGVGRLVGYQTRDERRIGADTRIEVVTEGILTRRLQRDPSLPGVGLVIFDEVHERNLTTDLGLAMLLDAAPLAPDRRIVAISATADTELFAGLLSPTDGPATPVLTAKGRTFPIDVRWRPRKPRDRLEPAVVGAVGHALRHDDGDALVFLPGIAEIRRCAAELAGVVAPDVDLRPLAGALSTADQDLALAPSAPGRRRVVLATDIAETSLTVEGVRIVVDSGLARAPRFDTGTGMTRLATVPISRDSADQRAGRAGRTEPGVAYRLWSRIEHGSRPAHRPAEIGQVELAGLMLELAAWGARELPFPEQPPGRAVEAADELLVMLGALDGNGAITPSGRRMSELPVHPRLARMIVEGRDALSCVVAALVDERDIMRGRPDDVPTDLSTRVALVTGHHHDERADRRGVARVRDRAGDLARRAGIEFDLDHVDGDRAGLTLLAGFPDRLAARRRGGQFQLRTGAGAWVRPTDPLADEPFVVAADLDGHRRSARIRLGGAVDADELAATLEGVIETERLEWDGDDLVVRVERRLDALRLGEVRRRPTPGDATTAALVDRVRSTALRALPWTDASLQLRARVALAREHLGDPWPDLGDEVLLATLDAWLAPYLHGATGADDLARLDPGLLMRAALPWPLGADLDELIPPALRLGSGREIAIDYRAERPTVSVRVQDVFGVRDHPSVVGGRVPLTLSLLSPADRPIQVTADLPGFWAGSWADVRKEMAGRYPKHRWPEHPESEPPGRLKPR